MDIIKHGFYIIKDDFFTDFPDQYLKGNKKEQRPHYYCFKDDFEIIWVIPATLKKDRIDKKIEEKKRENRKYEDLFHYLEIGHKTGVLLIADMFPITKKYIKREYTISGKAFKLLDKSKTSKIDKKANRILALLKKGTKFTDESPNVLKIESDLKSKLND